MRIVMVTLSNIVNISVDKNDTLGSSVEDRIPRSEENYSPGKTSDLPNIFTIFETDSDDSGEPNVRPSIVIIASAPLKESEIPSTWPRLGTTNSTKGWVSRREVMRVKEKSSQPSSTSEV